jgi:branched-chain amino acid transport system substrate-binding protein
MKYFVFCFLIVFSTQCKDNSYHFIKNGNSTGVTENEILIGSSSAIGGIASFLGKQLTQGSMSFLKEVNSKGGINGRQIKLKIYDDLYDPELTLENTEKLIKKDKVFILFDYMGTPTSKKIIKIINEEKIPVLGLFTGAEFLRNPFQPYVLNVRASYYAEVEKIVDYWISQNKSKISVFMQDDSFGSSVLSGAKLALSRYKLRVHSIGKFKRGEMPGEEEVDSLVKTAPDGIIMVGTYGPLARFVKMAKDRGLKNASFHTVSFVGSKAFAASLLMEGKRVSENVFVTQVVPSPYMIENKAVKEFTVLYKKYFPEEEVNYVALEGFINAKILVKALEKCGKNLTREVFIRTVETMSGYDAETGMPPDIAIDNHDFFEDVKISKIIDGKFQVIGVNNK